MPTLYFSEEHRELVEKLCNEPAGEDLPPIFAYYRDLMLLAAMIGKKHGRERDRKGIGGEVESSYFASQNFNKEGIIFLLGLLDSQNPEVLKDGASECWKLFERYCTGGMDIISNWLEEAESQDQIVEALQTKLLEIAKESKAVTVTVKKARVKTV